MSEATAPRQPIHVMAGLLIEHGCVCITRRRDDAHQGGKWEFPGGKLEAGEDPLTGLKRELHEELGIVVSEAAPFAQVRHVYPEVDVLLDVWRVDRYDGSPHGRETQELRWAEIARLEPAEFPDADRSVLRRLQLPPLYLLSDVEKAGREVFLRRLARALRAGARLVQLREPQMDRASFTSYARQVAALCHDCGGRFLVNADPSWVGECEADGVHLNSARLMGLSERPLTPRHWVGASCHNASELAKAEALGLDFAVLGPVRSTASHPGAATLGWERFAALCGSTVLPVYAIGGMRAADLAAARSAHGHGLAMISGVWGDPRFETVVRALA
jgi:8-oxo-dGTP diphosphatase